MAPRGYRDRPGGGAGEEGLTGEEAAAVHQQVRQELTALIHRVLDAVTYEEGEKALATLQAHLWGRGSGRLSTSNWIGCWCICRTTTEAYSG